MATKPSLLLGMCSLFLVQSVFAQEAAHVHGEAVLTIAIDGKRAEVALDTPTDTLWGFEHPPETKAEQDKVDAVKKRFADSAILLKIVAAAQCRQTAFNWEAEQEEHHDDDKKDDAPHKAEHDHDEHKAHHDGDEKDHHEHQDALISYTFDCARPELLTGFDVTLFANFSALQRLRVQWVDNKRQLEKELNPQATTFYLD